MTATDSKMMTLKTALVISFDFKSDFIKTLILLFVFNFLFLAKTFSMFLRMRILNDFITVLFIKNYF
jgi:hypothetical protein